MSQGSSGRRRVSIRSRVAREAAVLLYYGQEKEFKQAKVRAAAALGTRVLPSNREVALELDRVAGEVEGSARAERLIRLRREALEVMVVLGDLRPRLVGSVWRGTANRSSDVDVEVFHSDPGVVVERLRRGGFDVRRAEWQSVTKGVGREAGFHVFLVLSSGDEVEVVVRGPERADEVVRDEVFGDDVRGLSVHQLRVVLVRNPVQRFLPS